MHATVIIPCYRPDRNFEKMLADLNAQTSKDFCVILADDGNNPPLAPRVAEKLTRPHEVIRFDQNRGIVAGLNACVAQASTPYVIRMDADDRMPPDRIEKQLIYMQAHPNIDVAGAAMVVFGSGLRVWSKPTKQSVIKASLLWGPSFNHPTLIAKSAFMKANPYPSGFHLAEDYALWLQMSRSGAQMANVRDVLVYYRMEGQNTSQTVAHLRATRYRDMFKHAVDTLIGQPAAASLHSGIDLGCHHVLAGMVPPDGCKPTTQAVKSYAQNLVQALSCVEDSWVSYAQQDVMKRCRNAQGLGRWHKLESIWDLRRLRLSAWRVLLSGDL